MKNRTLTLAAALILTALVAAPSALGQGPPDPFEDSFTIEGICAFPVLVELSGKAKTIELNGGRMIFTAPAETATFTNLDTPAHHETLGITGAFHTTALEDGSTEFVVTGRNLLIGFDPDALFVITVGNFRFVLDDGFNLVQPLSGTGRVIDVCQLLE